MQVLTRSVRNVRSAARHVRHMGGHGGSGGHKAHVHMPETAMITNNGTHVFERKGWEYSTVSAFIAAPVILYFGLMNVPETDSEVFARNEAHALRKGSEQFEVVERPTGPIASKYTYERAEIGERPTLA
uniref:NADH dehydrogenase [ubiquinone] 1 beta subcomplex subunit 11, mitochondrial n=1 Tax=Globisporangium ultimum (strain ATCC 200006 / CBS 805.95 / DAOM BR144) TaxID=431595 RepID=K3W8A6_GLOUD